MMEVYVSVGSNIDRHQNIRSSLAALKQNYGSLLVSSVYESQAVGFEGDPFYNLVVGFEASKDVYAVSEQLKQIEARHGRDRHQAKFSSRTLDLDILLFGDQILKEQGFDIPRDEIQHYSFVLCPLAEIIPNHVHPVVGRTYAQLWEEYVGQGQTQGLPLGRVDFQWD